MPPFYRQLLALTLALIAIAAACARWAPQYVHPWFGWLLGYILTITVVAYTLIVRFVRRDPDSAVTAYLGSVTLRLLTSGVFLGVVLFRDPPQVWLLVLTFFLLYFMYTGLEIRAVVRTLRPFSHGGSSGAISSTDESPANHQSGSE